MTVMNPSSTLQADSTSGQPTEQKSTSGAAHINLVGTGLYVAANVSVNATITADVNAAVAAQAGLRLMGFSAKESAGTPAAATFRIFHGATVAGGTAVINQNFAASGSNTAWFSDGGIAVPNGLSIDWITGQVDVELFYKVVP